MYKQILVPLDGSELSELSLEHVKKLAIADNETEVILISVIEPISYLGYTSYSALREDAVLNIERQSQARSQDYVDKIADGLKKEGIKTHGVVVWGRPADEILKYVKEKNIDLVVMSTHGRSGMSHWALGSVAEMVIRNSTAPVLIIPPHGSRHNETQRA